jgi:hypothetical protein
VELVRLAARDRTDAAIAKPETPFVRVDELGGQISGNAWRAFTWTKPEREIGFGGFEHLRRPLRLLGKDEVCRDDRICRQSKCQKGTRADSLMREKISLIARFNSLQGLKKFPVRMRRELARKALS